MADCIISLVSPAGTKKKKTNKQTNKQTKKREREANYLPSSMESMRVELIRPPPSVGFVMQGSGLVGK
jgi:hypothetical protein